MYESLREQLVETNWQYHLHVVDSNWLEVWMNGSKLVAGTVAEIEAWLGG